MTRRLNGLARKFKALHIFGSSQWLLAVSYGQVRYTEDSIPNLVQAMQMGCNADGSDKCASNIHVDNK